MIGIAGIIVVLVVLHFVTSINYVTVTNKSSMIARDVQIKLIPTNRIYKLGDIAPGQSEGVYFIVLKDGQAKYSAVIGNEKVSGIAYGYITPHISKYGTLDLYGSSEKNFVR